MSRSVQSLLLWAVFALIALCSADCNMVDLGDDYQLKLLNKYSIAYNTFGRDDNIANYHDICKKTDDTKFTFGSVVNHIPGENGWKSHIVLLDSDCKILGIYNFPDNDSCSQWILWHPSMTYQIIITHLKRYAWFFNENTDIEIGFAYGSGVYKDGRGDCGCIPDDLGSDDGDTHAQNTLEESLNSTKTKQRHCGCSVWKDGSGKIIL